MNFGEADHFNPKRMGLRDIREKMDKKQVLPPFKCFYKLG